MTFLHEKGDLQSPALAGLRQFVLEWAEQWTTGTPDFESYEHELHQRVMAIERELLAEELARYDVRAKQIEVEGVKYRPTLTSTEMYLTTAGEVRVSRHLYSPAGRGNKSICPMELRTGIIGGYWTPRAARQGAFVVAQVTPGQGESLFEEWGGCNLRGAVWTDCPKSCLRIGKPIDNNGKRPCGRKKPSRTKRACW